MQRPPQPPPKKAKKREEKKTSEQGNQCTIMLLGRPMLAFSTAALLQPDRTWLRAPPTWRSLELMLFIQRGNTAS